MDTHIFQIRLKKWKVFQPSPGKMMLISQLPWSFLLAKAVALSVQERIEGWCVCVWIFTSKTWLEPGFFPRSGAIYNGLVVLNGVFLIPQTLGKRSHTVFVGAEKIPTGLSTGLRGDLLIEIWRSADLLIWIRNQWICTS